jgi:8-oxo-dGTP pyrophosphatase MutT (NUDIX family)
MGPLCGEALAGYHRAMFAVRRFAFCPRCAASARPADVSPAGPFRCASCGFVLFFNAASAVAALILREDDGRGLFIRRAKDPAKGRLAMPGGFVDPGESGEAAVVREVREEVGLELGGLTYLGSYPNEYLYAQVTYFTLDVFFSGTARDPDRASALDGVASVAWLDPLTVPLDEIAFPSMRTALETYRAARSRV